MLTVTLGCSDEKPYYMLKHFLLATATCRAVNMLYLCIHVFAGSAPTCQSQLLSLAVTSASGGVLRLQQTGYKFTVSCMCNCLKGLRPGLNNTDTEFSSR